ncbi:MAG: HAMP domain-containing histidine kinase [Clostridia bacterium]|nr:HAMP domain-containing histidine kinase [Clostridia bacterium]
MRSLKRFGRKDKKRTKKHRFSLTLLFAALVFVVLISALAIGAAGVYLLVYFEVIANYEDTSVPNVILFMALISVVMGALIAGFFSIIPLKPVNKWVNGMNRLASGDFKVRMKFGKPLGNHPTFVELSDSFNTLAEELQNTEMLRSDFINNFSHDFKTPIVSIAGFAKLLKRGNLTQEQQMQYLNAIEEESMRLSYMATNVLNLTKVENQAILSEVSRFNLSEQIRSSVLLLEDKWSKKELELSLDFDEYFIEANEELLKQMWINLLDNAVKFAPPRGEVGVEIREDGGYVTVSVSNTGNDISPDKLDRIWNKFYQADESHSSEGNGVGLAIVKRITELHSGSVSVTSENGVTTFTVELPKEQTV